MEVMDKTQRKQLWEEVNKSMSASIPLYMKNWYWDAVCNSDDWDVILNFENDDVESAFPYKYTRRKGMWFIELPWQVATAGIWFRHCYREESKEKELLYQTKQINNIIAQLPKYDFFRINFNHNLFTWHPFYWQGFKATPYYTSVLSTNVRGG